jgi:hypothetical protein
MGAGWRFADNRPTPLDIYSVRWKVMPARKATTSACYSISTACLWRIGVSSAEAVIFQQQRDLRARSGYRQSPSIGTNSGIWWDSSLAFSPEPDILAYLQDSTSGSAGDNGYVIAIDVGSDSQVFDIPSLTTKFEWSKEGGFILTSSLDSVYVFNRDNRLSDSVAVGTTLLPMAVFSPDDNYVAYIDADPENPALQQIYMVEGDGSNPRQSHIQRRGDYP